MLNEINQYPTYLITISLFIVIHMCADIYTNLYDKSSLCAADGLVWSMRQVTYISESSSLT